MPYDMIRYDTGV